MFPTFKHKPKDAYQSYICTVCGYIYDEAKGCAESKIAAGTRWDDLPWDWECPHCDGGKEDFNPLSGAPAKN